MKVGRGRKWSAWRTVSSELQKHAQLESAGLRTSACAATTRARSVLPVPGGPAINTPLGSRAPAAAYLPGSLSIETISRTSSLACL